MTNIAISGFVNLHGQPFPHEQGKIIGNPMGLVILRDAIQMALDERKSVEVELFASDGEGYTLRIEVVPNESLHSTNVQPQYTDYP